ncbi:hypothetical protein LTR85_001387 [Meristemomyces frigidus]|nr:hypothetical protein LTR85_001387 [Meristemomyces frigidus]
MATDNPPDANAQHLVILVHGLWGNPIHLKHLRETLAKKHEGEGVYIYIPSSNKDNFTYDGIEVGAERLTNEVEAKLKELEAAGSRIRKISVAGYSLGGLIARYVVGLLYKAGVFDDIQPMNFTTFATPHLGVRTPRNGYRAQTWNFLGSRTLSTSGQQMFLVDNFRGTGRPLLAVLADPNSIFVRGLSMFKHKSVYANTINDRSVPYYTSAISRVDPFVDLDAIEVHYLPGQDQPVILDPENPVEPRKEKEEKELSWAERYIMTQRTRESLPFYTILFSLLPVAVPLFLVNAGYQTYKSAQRVKLHEAGNLVDLKRYRIPLLEETQAVQDRMVERLAADRSQESYLPTPPPEPAASSASSSHSDSKSASSSESTPAREQHAKTAHPPWPTLALTDDQFAMIDSLDAHVGFTKYPCHIQKVRHTHAAIVMRMEKESFSEGREVSRHWIEGFEV